MARTGARAKPKVKPSYFTGRVRLMDAPGAGGSEPTRVYEVRFYSGARTKLHVHDGGQILVATSGRGSLATYRRPGPLRSTSRAKITRVSRILLVPGKAVYVPPGCLHTHGSVSKSQAFVHIAINMESASGRQMTTRWFDSDLATWISEIA